MNTTLESQEYFSGCNYTDSERDKVYSFLYSWSDITCFTRVFSQACTVFIKNEFYAWSSSASHLSAGGSGVVIVG